jgi:hypothetical protein
MSTYSPKVAGISTDRGVPASADVVVVDLVAIKPQEAGGFGGPGFLSATTTGSNPFEPVTPFADLPLNNATSITIPLDAAGKIAVDIDQISGNPVSIHIRTVVPGYLDTADGDDYSAVNPCAAFDTRTTIQGDSNVPLPPYAGKRSHRSPTNFSVTGAIPAAQGGELDCGIPAFRQGLRRFL